MQSSRARFIHGVILSLSMTMHAPLCAAQTPAPIPQAALSIPRKLTLAQAEQLLLQRNLAVLAAKYQVDAMRAARLIAGFKPNPVLVLGAEQFPFYSPLAGSYPRFFTTDGEAGAQPTYTFRVEKLWERGGKRELRSEQADYQLKANEALMLDAARTQLFQLRQAFTTAELARENLLLAEATKQEHDQTIKLTDAKVENGDLPRVELYRAQVDSLQYIRAAQQERTTYQQAARDILNLLGARVEDVSFTNPVVEGAPYGKTQIVKASYNTGDTGLRANIQPDPMNPDTTDILKNEPLEIDFKFNDGLISQSLDEMRRIALAERPDVIAARRLYDASAEGVQLAQSQRARDILISMFYQRVGSDHTLGVNVAFPLFVYNKGYAAISQAAAQKEAADSLSRQAELQAITDVEKAYLAYQSARRILDIYNASTIERAGKLKTVAIFSYREGASGLLDLLDAQRSYNQTITSYNKARADYQNALWDLEQAIGRPPR